MLCSSTYADYEFVHETVNEFVHETVKLGSSRCSWIVVACIHCDAAASRDASFHVALRHSRIGTIYKRHSCMHILTCICAASTRCDTLLIFQPTYWYHCGFIMRTYMFALVKHTEIVRDHGPEYCMNIWMNECIQKVPWTYVLVALHVALHPPAYVHSCIHTSTRKKVPHRDETESRCDEAVVAGRLPR